MHMIAKMFRKGGRKKEVQTWITKCMITVTERIESRSETGIRIRAAGTGSQMV